MNEIEKKFKIEDTEVFNNLPINKDSKFIRQYYLANDDDKEIRLRQIEKYPRAFGKDRIESEHYMTVKTKNVEHNSFKLLNRKEETIEITFEQFMNIVTGMISENVPVEKIRKVTDIDGYRVSIDRYHKHMGIVDIAEIEFNSVEDVNQFEKPDIFDKEVTNNDWYKNINIFKRINKIQNN